METIAMTVSAIGTAVAIFTSLFLLWQGQVDRRKLAEDRRRDQAARVTAWAEWNKDWDGATLAQPACPTIRVSNTSDAAVYDAFVDVTSPLDGETLRVSLGAIPPGGATYWNFEERFTAQGWEPEALWTRLYFRDARGERWKRDALGILGRDPGAGRDAPFKLLPSS